MFKIIISTQSMHNSKNSSASVIGERKCRGCRRHLRVGLFNLGSNRCYTCVRKAECKRRWKRYTSSVNNTFINRTVLAGEDAIDASIYLRSMIPEIRRTLEDGVEMHTSFRWLLSSTVVFEREVEGETQETRFDFYSDEQVLLRPDQIDEQIESAISRLLTQIQEMGEKESNFVFKRVFKLKILLARYNPIGGSSYIATPKELAVKKALVNVQNKDSYCFLYALASAIYPSKTRDPQRPSQYREHFSKFNIKGLKFPLDPKDIMKFEKMNPDIAVNVLHYDTDKTIVPLVHTSHLGRMHEVNMFLLSEEVEDAAGNVMVAAAVRKYRYHYTWIKNPSHLFRSATKHNGVVKFCFNCFRRFWSVDKFKSHRPHCIEHAPVRIMFPSNQVRKSKKDVEISFVDSEDEEEECELETIEEALDINEDIRIVEDKEKKPENILEFNQLKNTFMVPFVLYVDFETFIKKGDEDDMHEPSGFCCLRVSSMDFLNTEKAFVYSGPNVMSKYYEHIMKEHGAINDILSLQKPMAPLTEAEQERYDAATVCGTCKQKFTEDNVKVRHHNHLSGKFIRATCNSCNLKLKPAKAFKKKINKFTIEQKIVITEFVEKQMKDEFFVPVIAHNMRGYDSHLIIKHMEKMFATDNIQVIASNSEKFTAFQIGQLRFLDSLQFLNASLDALVSNLKRDLEKDGVNRFKQTRRYFSWT